MAIDTGLDLSKSFSESAISQGKLLKICFFSYFNSPFVLVI